jgi:hypothetical protein
MPVAGAFWLTLFLAITLVVTGVIRIIMAFQIRDQGSVWLWVLFTGIVSIVLGVLIYGMVTPPTPEALATPEDNLSGCALGVGSSAAKIRNQVGGRRVVIGSWPRLRRPAELAG